MSAITKITSARFWTYINGTWSKITVKQGQQLHWSRHAPHEEGWESEAFTWVISGETLYRSLDTESQDCDGYHSDVLRSSCHIPRGLKGRSAIKFGPHRQLTSIESMITQFIRVPSWIKIHHDQYDQRAEAAGY